MVSAKTILVGSSTLARRLAADDYRRRLLRRQHFVDLSEKRRVVVDKALPTIRLHNFASVKIDVLDGLDLQLLSAVHVRKDEGIAGVFRR